MYNIYIYIYIICLHTCIIYIYIYIYNINHSEHEFRLQGVWACVRVGMHACVSTCVFKFYLFNMKTVIDFHVCFQTVTLWVI